MSETLDGCKIVFAVLGGALGWVFGGFDCRLSAQLKMASIHTPNCLYTDILTFWLLMMTVVSI